jgi:outer membrane protein assembly factor BamB/tRNA A-37 threonylcarbamoyl transferase component Bud32
MSSQGTQQFVDLETPPAGGSLQAGATLQNRYQIIETRNIGGMAVVYKARDLRFEKAARICAVKEMYNSAADPRLRDLTAQIFDREANVLASLSHPAIPSIFDYFSESNRLYLVMEYIEGQDLDEIIEESQTPLAQQQVIDWAVQICDVLSYLHTRPDPVIFRDLKPSNIMLNQHGRIVVIDFGIAKRFQAGQRGTMIGTAGYPPPEQYRGDAEPRGDIYALGATMHHLLTKRDPRLEPPFSFHEHPIRSLNPNVSEELDKIVMKALEYDIEKRFATAREFKEALDAQLAPRPFAAPTVGSASTVAFATSALAFTQSGRVQPVWEFACEDQIGSSPAVADGAVYIGSFDHNLYAIDATDGTFMWKFATEDAIASSPHVWNDRVFVGSDDRLMYAIDRQSGQIVWSTPTRGRVISSPREAMSHVFFGSDDHMFYNLDARNGRQVWVFEAQDHIRSSPAVSGEIVCFGSDDYSVYALDIQSGTQKWKFATHRPVISSPLLYEGMVYFGSLDWTFYAVSAEAGFSVWTRRTRHRIVSSPVVSEALGLIYFTSVDHGVYALDHTNGQQAWRFEMDGPGTTSSPAISGEAVYVGSSDGHLYSLNARSGELRWKFDTGSSVVSSPAIWENMVYIGSRNHRVYALLL